MPTISVSSTLWYVLTLLSYNPSQIQKNQSIITNFISAGSLARARLRVQAELIVLLKLNRGLGVIAVGPQSRAVCLKLFLWAFQCGNHPLKRIIRKQICPFSSPIAPSLATIHIFLTTLLRYSHLLAVLGSMCQAWKYTNLQPPPTKKI